MRLFINDDNQFKDGILAFDRREKGDQFNNSGDNRLYSYLILDFKLPVDIVFDDFTIEKSIEVDLNISTSTGQSVKKAFVSPVKMPERIGSIFSHDFTFGLSAICSFAFERPVLSTKNDYYNRVEIANELELREIGVEFPRTIIGPGAKGFSVHKDIIELWVNRLKEVINLINLLTTEENETYPITYERLMQSFRLIQLAHINRKEDFDLGYSFLIAGIEGISQIAIPKIDRLEKTDQYKKWKALSKKDDEMKSLFDEYVKVKIYVDTEIQNKNLTKRFAKFLFSFSKQMDWEEVFYDQLITEGPEYNNKYPNEIISRWRELSPLNLSDEEFFKIIKDTYNLRSKFFHEGLPLPHKNPSNSIINRFFHVITNHTEENKLKKIMNKENRNESKYTEWDKTQDKLITFEFLSSLARNSITNYLKNVLQQSL